MNRFITHPPSRAPTPEELTRLTFGFGIDELVRQILDGSIVVPGGGNNSSRAGQSTMATSQSRHGT